MMTNKSVHTSPTLRAAPGARTLRWAGILGLAALTLIGFGDGVRAAYSIQGIDPLGVLELKVRPNVIVVLDTSGSMTGRTGSGSGTMWGGDHPRSKMYIAKQVLKDVVFENQSKVSFMYGTYTQSGSSIPNRDWDGRNRVWVPRVGEERFRYVVNSLQAPSMVDNATQLKVIGQPDGAGNPVGTRGLQAWQDIRAGWNTLVFQETRGSARTCTVTVPVGFYRTGAALAAVLQTEMNACTGRNTPTNTYAVTFDTTNGRFTFARSTARANNFSIRWAEGANPIRGALGMYNAVNTASDTNAKTTGDSYILLRRFQGRDMSETFDPDGSAGSEPSQLVGFYNLRAGRFWNGQTVLVTGAGAVCGFGPDVPQTPPVKPSVFIQRVDSCGGSTVDDPVRFFFAGGRFSGSGGTCNGFAARASLVPCDLDYPPAPFQFDTIFPYLDDEFQVNAATDGSPRNYTETADGAYHHTWTTPANDSGKADGWTPIANSLNDIKTAFIGLWNTGQAGTTAMAGPPPWEISAIRTHADPKERTIVLFVTDGDDTCGVAGGTGSIGGSQRARRAARAAERLYDPAMSNWDNQYLNMTGITPIGYEAARVQTYMIGYGGAFSGGVPTYLNWIAWGGSGMKLPASGSGTNEYWTNAPTAANRAACKTCVDAFVAPDGDTLKQQLQSIIDQGATAGEFSASGGGAMTAVTDNVWEYVGLAMVEINGVRTYPFSPLMPNTKKRHFGSAPTRFVATFKLPGFEGQLKAYHNDGENRPVLRWSAGDILRDSVVNGMIDECPVAAAYAPGLEGECVFAQLTGGVEYSAIEASSAAIKRRIFTTAKNGYFGVTAAQLMDAQAPGRVALWPPQSASLPSAVDPPAPALGLLDGALGLPTTNLAADFTALQNDFGACKGAGAPAACASSTLSTKVGMARKEARQMVLAFLAGAEVSLQTDGPKRVTASSAAQGQILYKARSWILAEGTLATPAAVGPPLEHLPADYKEEYLQYRDGPRDLSTGFNPDTGGALIKRGFGLRNPDRDKKVEPEDYVDTRDLKPVMSVVYYPSNAGVHAFRSGPSCATYVRIEDTTDPRYNGYYTCPEVGGEELWSFVPFDQLDKLSERVRNDPQTRKSHVYMIARGLRFSEVFVREDLTDVDLAGVTIPTMKGLWRRVLIFGRGAGGKYLTALDITAPGKYSDTALSTTGPIPLWSRGNPDTEDGTVGGTRVWGAADFNAYARMGETWSVPAMAYTDPFYTTRKPEAGGKPVEFLSFVGSGYGSGAEGSTIFTLDSLTGDVVATAEVVAKPHQPTGNALVASAAAYLPGRFRKLEDPTGVELPNDDFSIHPNANKATRVYIGDLHGQLWKLLVAEPGTAILAADLGPGQPIGTPVSLIGLEPLNVNEIPPVAGKVVPHIYGVSGNDSRHDGPFKLFALRDEGTDTDTATTATVAFAGITVMNPVTLPKDPVDASLFLPRTFDAGDGGSACGDLPETVFRGDVQPSTTFAKEWKRGVVFFAGNRFNLPNTKFAPRTPLKCPPGVYPCRSSFDSIVYVLGAASGEAAYTLGGADNSYRIFYDSRTGSIRTEATPDSTMGATGFSRDETLIKGDVRPPPPPGIPPSLTTATNSVVPADDAGKPVPAMIYGSTVCK